MKIEILYSTKSNISQELALSMAKWVKTSASPIKSFVYTQPIDLLVIVFKDGFFNDGELVELIKSLDRTKVYNLCLVNSYYYKPLKLNRIIKLCQNSNLPLMREHYSFKVTYGERYGIKQVNIDGARLYIEDMVNLIINYY